MLPLFCEARLSKPNGWTQILKVVRPPYRTQKCPDALAHTGAAKVRFGFLSQVNFLDFAYQCHTVGFEQLHDVEHFIAETCQCEHVLLRELQ